jgi:hypothetical protein
MCCNSEAGFSHYLSHYKSTRLSRYRLMHGIQVLMTPGGLADLMTLAGRCGRQALARTCQDNKQGEAT